jgi:voltage-gated sodium channel
MGVSNGDSGHLYTQIATEDYNDDFGYREEAREFQQKPCCQVFVESSCFQMFIGFVISANAVVIGMETDVAEYQWLWQNLEDIFLLIFFLELLLKFCAYGIGFFKTSNPDVGWNIFDFTIVSFGCADRILSHVSPEHGSGARFFVLLMRTFRLLRILRIIRIFRLMKQLYLLAKSMLDSFSAVFWVSFLCALILYICAIVITRLIGQPNTSDDQSPFLDEFRIERFGSVKTTMLTLFRLMAFPDMEPFKPVYNKMPWFALFLVAFIIFGAFAVVALLTGVVCEAMVAKSRRREDEQRFEADRSRYRLAEDLRRLFKKCDASGSGSSLTRSQFEQSKVQVFRLCDNHCVRLRPQDLDALFELVDDGSGTIDTEELLYGMLQLNSEVRPMSIMELRRLVVRGLTGVSEQMTRMDERMQQMNSRLCELQAAARYGALGGLPDDKAAASMPSNVDSLGQGTS